MVSVVGMSHGAESALSNPAMITSVKGTEVSFGGTVFMPDVQTQQAAGAGFSKSASDLSVIPEVSLASKSSDNFWWGVGMWGTAGMGVDYRDASGTATNFNMVTNLQLMQFGVPLAYKVNALSFGITPIVQYGSLDINFDQNGYGTAGGESQTRGVAQDFGFGYNLGVAYEVSGLTLGASYKSAIDMQYKGQISKASAQFGINAGAGFSDNLEQPAEIGVGASYKMGAHTVAIDYKKIKWGSAKGYKDFNWEDQNVYILGYQFKQDNWALRAGYNHGNNPIKEMTAAQSAGNYQQINTFNLIGFPGIVENHYTLGGTYAFNKMTSVDMAYVYSPETEETYTGYTGATTTKHSQDAVSVQLNFNF